LVENKVLGWLGNRKLELAIFALGVLLRTSMAWNYAAEWSYDSDLHWAVVQWIAAHGHAPHPEATFEAFHPPLFYAFAAWLTTLGVTRSGMAWVSIVAGSLRLAVIWAGLELYVVHSRLARVLALTLAAVLAASVHLDGMVYPEALSCLWNALVMLLVPLAFRRTEGARWPLTLAIGALLGLAVLTKISAVTVLLAIGLAAALELAQPRRPMRRRIADAVPWAGTLVVMLALCGWYYASNVREYGRPFVTSFDLPSQQWLVKDSNKLPYEDRRTLGFVFGWDESLYVHPFAISNAGAHARFFPVAMASTFVDFWCYGYQGYDRPFHPKSPDRVRRDQRDTTNLARSAVVGGTVILLAVALAWIAALKRTWEDRDFGRLALVLVPLTTTLASLHFATQYPVDGYGIVKGIYMTFGAPPLYALFGVAGAWAARCRDRWPILVVLVAALWAAAAYTIFCRFGLRLLPW
jgi:4-amino-4-deoxy-L-arabinose transferase-like glycosyltransferase